MPDSSSQNRLDFDESSVEEVLDKLYSIDEFRIAFSYFDLDDLPGSVGRFYNVHVDEAIPWLTGEIKPIARALAVASDQLGIDQAAQQFQILAALGPTYLSDESLAIASEVLRTRLTNLKSQLAAETESTGGQCDPPEPPVGDVPDWNKTSLKLNYQGEVVRSVAGHATSLIAILDNFQLEGWPIRIDDPLPGGKNPDRLSNAIRSLNSGLEGIAFAGGGDGESIRWDRIGPTEK